MKKSFIGGFLFLFFVSCGGEKATNILQNKQPIQSQGIVAASKMTDGKSGEEGAFWRSEQTTFLQSQDSFVIYDLGQSMPLAAFYLQGDNNDLYQVFVSDDLTNWNLAWTAGPKSGAGLRGRWVSGLTASGRYLKLQATGGDGAYSVSEWQAYSSAPSSSWKPEVDVEHSSHGSFAGRVRMIVFGLVLILYSLFSYSHKDWVYRLALIPLLTAYELYRWILSQYEVGVADDLDLAFLKLVISCVGIFVLVQNQYFPQRFKPRKNVLKAILLALALFAVSIYYHFGHSQFDNYAARRKTAVHLWDMRVYYPIAKFFKELQFDGLYLACLQGYVEEHPETTDQDLARVRLRDLSTNEVVSGLSVKTQAQEIKSRFTPERWDEFKRDMRWFDRAMGVHYLGSMTDHGGNATPLWMWVGHFLLKDTKDVEATLTWTAWIDPVLLLILFVVIGRTFGWIPMCVCMIVFGATEFYRFGSNLMGSTLRQDWLVAFGLGVCALKREKYVWGGVGLAYSALIRAFPALGFLGIGLWWLVEVGTRLYRKEKITLRALFQDYLPFWKTVLGSVLCVALTFGVTTATFGYQHSWGPWFKKITMHADKPNVNHLGFRNNFSYDSEKTFAGLSEHGGGDWIETQRETYVRRKYFMDLAIVATLIVLAYALRGKSLYQCGLLGLLFIPAIFYPANYYFHYVFLLPMIGVFSKDKIDEESTPYFVQISCVLLAMCAVHYFPLLEGQMDVSFTEQSWILLVGFGLLLLFSVLCFKKEDGQDAGS